MEAMFEQKKILVVEDNKINRAMLAGILSPEYKILEAENGQEALDVLAQFSGEIALILLDIMMPVMDGYTFLSRMKAEPGFASIPVIVTTQSDSESDEVSALSHGATDFVAKPYKPQVILHRVASIINLRETAAMVNQFQYDRLTGLYSKEFFYRKARDILTHNPDKQYDVIGSDIENFKLINDIFGVQSGDKLLCQVAEMYQEEVRGLGIAGRFNADQFVCLVEHRAEYTDQMFIQAGSRINALSAARSVVMKWGIYAVGDRSLPVEQMCDRALLAARSIQGQYGKYFAVYDDALRNKLLREQAITDGMEGALAGGQFEVYLQPKYRIGDGKLAGAESLVRWNHPEWGLQSPAEFIPLFEKNGFITELDRFVWDRTCQMLRQWEDQGLAAIPVSVNVSRADAYHADLAQVLMKTVGKYGLSPARLHLEITESAYTENPDQIIDTVSHLRKLGFIIEMDDFGSGYSSLNMLHKMPLDILKLDMKFIQSETAKPVGQGILRFIMGLARWMNLGVVAEGVETKEQLERLREIGCDYVQGYYFARPMPCAEFEQLLRRQEVAGEEDETRREPGEGPLPEVLLVADEDPGYRQQVRRTFGGRFQVEEAADGPDALRAISLYAHQLSAAVLSMTLPGPEDGLTVLEDLQRENELWSIPVVVTGPADAGLEDRAFALGADDYAARPHTQASLWKRVAHVIGMTAFRERERTLQDEAYRDYMTGLLNRRGLTAAAKSLRKEDAPLAVYLFDLDNLKESNDTFGHAAGDQLIQHFGELLRTHTRGTDILSRFGGDEFVVVMKRMPSADLALKKGEEICRALQESHAVPALNAACTAGIAQWDMERPLEEMIARADQALYRAKNSRKGGCCLWRA